MARQRKPLGCGRVVGGVVAAVFLLALLGHLVDEESMDSAPSAETAERVDAVQPDQPTRPAEPARPKLLPDGERDAKLRRLLADGDGTDWLALSTQEKLELGQIIAEQTGRHEMIDYRDAVEIFYQDAKADGDRDLLAKPIAEVGAQAAAQMDAEARSR